jgi:recyclin-1
LPTLSLSRGCIRYRLFESNMDEYLDEEVDWVKGRLEKICGEWNKKVG